MNASVNSQLSWRSMTIAIATLTFTACSQDGPVVAAVETEEAAVSSVVVYSTVEDSIIKRVLDAYAAETDVNVYVVTGEFQELLDKVHKRGPDPVADLFVSDNAADLWSASEQDVFRPTRSEIINNRVPGQLRDPEHLWTSLAVRARTIVYNTELLSATEIESVTDYTSLTTESWRDRLCMSSSGVPGNASLIAMLINDNGVGETEVIVRGWRANFALPVFDNDARLLQAIATGQCAIGIADSSEVAAFLRANENASVAQRWFPESGVLHINASGAGVTRHAQNPGGAAALLEWLTSESANGLFAALRLEFPANIEVTADAAISDWAGFASNPANLASLGYSQEEAVLLAERARYP